jgi:3-phenylpropionate/trans-cinnamate dioxygenase ferredoxin component
MYNYLELDSQQIEYVEVASQDEIVPGQRLFVEIDEYPMVIFNIAGHLFAIGDVCSHDDGPLGDGELEGHAVVCPRHGARFDVRNGKVLSLPAIVDIPAYPVRVVEGTIEVGVPLERS